MFQCGGFTDETTRYAHGCGTINAQDGSGNREVVGAGDVAGSGAETVEIYSTVDDSWRFGISNLKKVKPII